MESIDKLFNCMADFYGTRWTKQFDRWFPEALAKCQWQSALQGLTHDEIRCVLVLLRQEAKNPYISPIGYMEFYSRAKEKRPTSSAKTVYANRGNSEIARRALEDIAEKLGRKKSIGCST